MTIRTNHQRSPLARSHVAETVFMYLCASEHVRGWCLFCSTKRAIRAPSKDRNFSKPQSHRTGPMPPFCGTRAISRNLVRFVASNNGSWVVALRTVVLQLLVTARRTRYFLVILLDTSFHHSTNHRAPRNSSFPTQAPATDLLRCARRRAGGSNP